MLRCPRRQFDIGPYRLRESRRVIEDRVSVTTIGLACAPEEPRTCEWMHCALLVTLRALLCSVPIVTPVAAGSDGTTLAFSQVASALAPSNGTRDFPWCGALATFITCRTGEI